MQDADVLIGNGRTALSGEASLETLQARYKLFSIYGSAV